MNDTVVPPPGESVDEFTGNPIIQLAVRHIRAAALAAGVRAPISTARAAYLLSDWEHFGELSEREMAAVLRRFPEPVVSAPTGRSAPLPGFNPSVLVLEVQRLLAEAGIPVVVDLGNAQGAIGCAADLLRCLGVAPASAPLRATR